MYELLFDEAPANKDIWSDHVDRKPARKSDRRTSQEGMGGDDQPVREAYRALKNRAWTVLKNNRKQNNQEAVEALKTVLNIPIYRSLFVGPPEQILRGRGRKLRIPIDKEFYDDEEEEEDDIDSVSDAARKPPRPKKKRRRSRRIGK